MKGAAVTTPASVEVARLLSAGWTVNRIAVALRRDWFTVYRWLKGVHNPDPQTIERLKAM